MNQQLTGLYEKYLRSTCQGQECVYASLCNAMIEATRAAIVVTLKIDQLSKNCSACCFDRNASIINR